MTATVTDLFCGAGGSSLGAEAAGMQLVMAANHWSTAIDVHQANFPDAGHDCADISQVDPRRYPRTDVLLASPECTNHSQARGVSRRKQDLTLFDAPDPAAERSRATMWDVPRFAEQLAYDAIVVENVVEATKWVGWRGWCLAMEDLGYERRILSHNSMHHGVAQSRDRIYVVFTRKGLRPDLELELPAWCPTCEQARPVRQAWKPDRTVGRYRQQWMWACTSCGDTSCEPDTVPAAEIIDWALECPRIGDRKRPLAKATRKRILAGLERYGWVPVVTAGAGNTYEATPGNRARPLTDPLPVQTTTATHALAQPPGFLASITRRSNERGGLGALDEPMRTQTAQQEHGLVVPMRRNGRARGTDEPVPTVTAGGTHHGLLMRNNRGGAEMVTPTDEPARTITSRGHQSLLVPYYGNGQAQTVGQPMPTVTTRDRCALVDVEAVVDDCGFRMLEPHEIAAAMAFPDGYIPGDLTKKDRVKLAGNAVTPPVMQWITGRLLQALEAA
jgi:DNA (cytosine-5)-methyltransferase 1